jgi:hypothetical protein
VAGVIIGLALVGGAVYAQTFVLTPDEKDDPLTVSGGMHDELNATHFSARLERVESARTVRVKKQYSTDEPAADGVFLIVRIGATTPRRPIHLAAHLMTADGLRFEPTDRVDEGATLRNKWVQPGWWASGLYFFDLPPAGLPGARVVIAEPPTLFGESYLPEASFDLGLDQAKARRLTDAAKDVYEVSG